MNGQSEKRKKKERIEVGGKIREIRRKEEGEENRRGKNAKLFSI